MRAWLAVLFLVGVSVTSSFSPVVVPAGCLPLAAQYEYAYKVKTALSPYSWCRIVRVNYGPFRSGHALAIFQLSNGDVYSYDTLSGSEKLSTRSHDLSVIVARLKERDRKIWSGEWLD